MHKRSKSNKLLNKLYMIIGKTVVFTGAFCGLFFTLNIIISFLEPFIVSATHFCVTNIKWIMIGVFIVVAVIWSTTYITEILSERRSTKSSDIE